MSFKMLTQLQLSLSMVYFLITFLTQHLGLKQPSIFESVTLFQWEKKPNNFHSEITSNKLN